MYNIGNHSNTDSLFFRSEDQLGPKYKDSGGVVTNPRLLAPFGGCLSRSRQTALSDQNFYATPKRTRSFKLNRDKFNLDGDIKKDDYVDGDSSSTLMPFIENNNNTSENIPDDIDNIDNDATENRLDHIDSVINDTSDNKTDPLSSRLKCNSANRTDPVGSRLNDTSNNRPDDVNSRPNNTTETVDSSSIPNVDISKPDFSPSQQSLPYSSDTRNPSLSDETSHLPVTGKKSPESTDQTYFDDYDYR